MASRVTAPCIAALTFLGACVQDQPFYIASSKLTVQVGLGDGALRLEHLPDGREQLAPESSAVDWLTYTFSGNGGEPLREGRIPDPRSERIEWEEDRTIRAGVLSGDFGSFVLSLPNAEGELVLREERPEGLVELGRAHVEARDPSSHALGLADESVVGPVQPVMQNGPAPTSVDILFLPEGYTRGDMGRFHAVVDRVFSALLARPDWGRYGRNFNILLQDVPSVEAGVDDYDYDWDTFQEISIPRNTAFDFRIRPLQGSTGEVVKPGPQGEALINRLGSRANADLVVVVVNAQRYYRSTGGSVVYLSPDDLRPDVIAHELGHALLHLADEYEESGTCGSSGNRTPVNVSLSADRNRLPWADLVEPETPLPTPPRVDEVGAFQGAWTCAAAFRPANECMMRHNQPAACPVCQREMDKFMGAYGTGDSRPREDHGGQGDPPPPNDWHCSAGYRGGGDACDCGCGALDPDCNGGGCAEPGCAQAACAFCYDAAGAQVPCPAPEPQGGGGGAGGGEGGGPGDPDGGGENQDPCATYDWMASCQGGDGRCDEGDGCCGYDPDNYDGTCEVVGGGGGEGGGEPYDPCASYNRNIYCVGGDDFCDEADACCDSDSDNTDGGPCRRDGDIVDDEELSDECDDYRWDVYCRDGDDYCDEDDGCCEYDDDDHDGGPCRIPSP